MKPQPLAEPRSVAGQRRRTWIEVAAAALALIAVGVVYAAFRPGAVTPPGAVRPAAWRRSISPDRVGRARGRRDNALIRDRLSQLPGLALSERAVDAPLATIRLSGSARTEGKRLRVQLRLDGERGADLWSSDLTLPLDEGYRVAEQVAAAVQEAASISRSDKLPASLPFTTLQAYLQARTELRERRAGFRQRLMIASAEVVRAEPGLRRARRSGPTPACSRRPLTLPAENPRNLQCARDAVARALALDPELAEAHAAAGLLALTESHACFDGCPGSQWYPAAQRSLERAVRLDPSLLEARVWLANTYDELGDLTRAAEQREAAVALDPLSPIANFHMNNVLLARGERDRVRDRLQRMAQIPGMPPYLYQQLAEVSIADGRFEEARGWARHVAAADDALSYRLIAATLLARSGATDEARALYASVPWKPQLEDDADIYYAVQLHQILGGVEQFGTS